MNFHIAYLLTKHECVIIPGFGAFVTFIGEKDTIKKAGLLCPPTQSLGFNPEIKHNDGLLANAISKDENISYQKACLQIYQYADFLNYQLAEQKSIQLFWIGKLSLSEEKKIIFTPSLRLSCNANNFGFNNFYMPMLSELNASIEYPVVKTNSEPKARNDWFYIPVSRRIVRWTGSVAATLLVLFLVSTPLNEYSSIRFQQAGFVSLPQTVQPLPAREGAVIKPIEETPSIPMANKEEPQPIAAKKAVLRHYYIIIASLPSKNSAQKQLEEFQKSGFSSADILSAENKHRIYINTFENKQEAEAFLLKFRVNYPQLADAWLLSQRD
jgi:nucleoid DNA-binding protein